MLAIEKFRKIVSVGAAAGKRWDASEGPVAQFSAGWQKR